MVVTTVDAVLAMMIVMTAVLVMMTTTMVIVVVDDRRHSVYNKLRNDFSTATITNAAAAAATAIVHSRLHFCYCRSNLPPLAFIMHMYLRNYHRQRQRSCFHQR